MSEPLSESDLVAILDRARCAGEARFKPQTLTREQRERAADTQALLVEIARLRQVVKAGADTLEEVMGSDPEMPGHVRSMAEAEAVLARMRLEEHR